MNYEALNAASGFGKIFQQNMEVANQNLNVGDEFQDIFQNMQQNTTTLKGGVEHFTGMDTIATQGVESLSETAQMAEDFGNGFKNGLNSLNTQQKTAEKALETFATGGDISVHEVMIASQKSSLSMQMALQLRNQMLNAYTELKDIRL